VQSFDVLVQLSLDNVAVIATQLIHGDSLDVLHYEVDGPVIFEAAM
jgi:hypothetical protein